MLMTVGIASRRRAASPAGFPMKISRYWWDVWTPCSTSQAASCARLMLFVKLEIMKMYINSWVRCYAFLHLYSLFVALSMLDNFCIYLAFVEPLVRNCEKLNYRKKCKRNRKGFGEAKENNRLDYCWTNFTFWECWVGCSDTEII